ncbi:MAG: hypothetical protein ACE5JZ_01460 [Kiloniellales bacterium]
MPSRFGVAGTFTVAALGLGAAVLAGVASAAERPKWIVDPANGCGTSNPFPSREESIKWYGDCKDGRVHGRGTLIWYRNQVESERNEGTFKDGELHGEVITTYPDGHVIVGQYRDGQRHGTFITIKPNGTHIESTFGVGKLQHQRKLSAEQIAAWKQERAAKLAASLPAGAPRLADARPQPAAPAATRSAVQATPAQAGKAWLTRPPIGAAPAPAAARPATPTPTNLAPSSAASEAAAQVVRDRPAPTELARRYAGWRAATTPYEGPVGAIGGTPGPAPLGGPAYPTQTVPARPLTPGTAAADNLFTKGYQAERSGQFYEAEKIYETILLKYPSAQTAMLANTRLDALRGRNRANSSPSAAAAAGGAGSRVVAVNAPNPVRRPGTRVEPPNPFHRSADVGRRVCTVEGLYEGGARWCGIIIRDEVSHYRVEVRHIELPTFGTIGIGRSTCTGNTFLNWFSRGTPVRVPKQCMSFQG